MYFYDWLQKRNADLLQEFLTVGHSEDWSDEKATRKRLNGPEYKARGIRSRYVANMKAGKSKIKYKKKPK